ncbi:MAG: minichromosome maintenance protein MCM [Candidatus Bathyarchaeota archaeon]|nr:minichromosome maintenance protein MCM [Candidatus Bathyarchaeota archaeon]
MDAAGMYEGFLSLFKEQRYRERIQLLGIRGFSSLTVDFLDVAAYSGELADALISQPDVALEQASAAATEQLNVEAYDAAGWLRRHGRVRVRVVNLADSTRLRELGAAHIGRLVSLSGIVVRQTPVRPLVMEAAFRCRRCGGVTRIQQHGVFLQAPHECVDPSCRGHVFDFCEADSSFIDSQELRLQESPDELPPGEIPRSLSVHVTEDLVNKVRPGDRVIVVGVVRTVASRVPKAGVLRAFQLTVEANSVMLRNETLEPGDITFEEKQRILELAARPDIHKLIVDSIAPSIYGYEHVKMAAACCLFGGVSKTLDDIKTRGEVNVLLVGDPGVAKSQLLRRVSEIAPRGICTSGRGSTAAGLTAAVVRNEKEGGMVLEAGAVVLADRGIACIDEIDKMREDDRVALHEVMEQHTVSIAKGGIVATLNAHTSIFAAANPLFGRYDEKHSITDNIPLPVTILSRFDLIFVIRDVPEKERDTKLSSHVLSIHKKSTAEAAPIPSALLKKYIAYSKEVNPKLTEEAVAKLQSFYLEMRGLSEKDDMPVAITVRQLESLVRLAEAHARMALRSEVTAEDAEAAISLMRRSLNQVGVDVEAGKLDIDTIMTGKPKSSRDKASIILGEIENIEKQAGVVDKEYLLDIVEKSYGITRGEIEKILEQLQRSGTIYTPREGLIRKANLS